MLKIFVNLLKILIACNCYLIVTLVVISCHFCATSRILSRYYLATRSGLMGNKYLKIVPRKYVNCNQYMLSYVSMASRDMINYQPMVECYSFFHLYAAYTIIIVSSTWYRLNLVEPSIVATVYFDKQFDCVEFDTSTSRYFTA